MPFNGAPNTGPISADTAFVNPGDKFWSMYIEDSEKYDKVRLERWKGDTDGILIFTGLFAATIAALLALTIPQLSPDSGEQTAVLLSQVLYVLVNHSENSTLPASAPPDYNFGTSTSSIWINSLWLVSLSMSLICALAATLVQQWAREYLQETQRRGNPSVRGPVYAALATEIERFHMEDAISCIISLLHVAVFLFFVGLFVMVVSVNHRVGIVLATFLAAGVLGYVTLSLLPIITYRSPYRTPLSNLIRRAADVMMTLFNRERILVWIKDWLKKYRHDIVRLFNEDVMDEYISVDDDVRARTLDISNTHKRLRAGSVAANVSVWTHDEWDEYHFDALNQLYKSVDQLNEAEDFCDSLTSLLDTCHVRVIHPSLTRERLMLRRQSFALREFIVVGLNIQSLLDRLMRDASDSRARGNHASSTRRVTLVMVLIRTLLRDCDFEEVNVWPARLQYNTKLDNGETLVLSRVVDMIPAMIWKCDFMTLTHFTFPYEGGPSQSISLTFWYFFAAVRADLFATCLNRLCSRTSTANLKSWYFEKMDNEMTYLEEGVWLHKISYFHISPVPDNPALHVQQALLDSFLWIYSRTVEVASEPEGATILHDLQNMWIPLMLHSFEKAERHFPASLDLMDESINDLRNIIRRLGLDQHTSLENDEDWLSRCADEKYTQLNVDRRYAPLFQNRSRFGHWLSLICRNIQNLKESERNKPPDWMKSIGDPYDVIADAGISEHQNSTTTLSDEQPTRTERARPPAADELNSIPEPLRDEGHGSRTKLRAVVRQVIRTVFRRPAVDETQTTIAP